MNDSNIKDFIQLTFLKQKEKLITILSKLKDNE
jgi:hypothetical protein